MIKQVQKKYDKVYKRLGAILENEEMPWYKRCGKAISECRKIKGNKRESMALEYLGDVCRKVEKVPLNKAELLHERIVKAYEMAGAEEKVKKASEELGDIYIAQFKENKGSYRSGAQMELAGKAYRKAGLKSKADEIFHKGAKLWIEEEAYSSALECYKNQSREKLVKMIEEWNQDKAKMSQIEFYFYRSLKNNLGDLDAKSFENLISPFYKQSCCAYHNGPEMDKSIGELRKIGFEKVADEYQSQRDKLPARWIKHGRC